MLFSNQKLRSLCQALGDRLTHIELTNTDAMCASWLSLPPRTDFYLVHISQRKGGLAFAASIVRAYNRQEAVLAVKFTEPRFHWIILLESLGGVADHPCK